MPKRVSIHDRIVPIGRVKDGQPIRYSEHHLDKTSQAPVMRLPLELTLARCERQRGVRGRWISSVDIWESVSEQVTRIIALLRAKEL